MKITTQDYGQFLINGVNNFTATHFSEIVEGLKHDSVSRYLNGSKISSKAVWERVENEIIYSKKSFVYDFLASMRQKINDPLGVRKKRQKQGQ